MPRRIERVSEAIREVVSTAILFELNDPRVKGVTVVGAEVTGDLRHAKIFVSIMGDERQQDLVLHGLLSARGFLQRKVAKRLETRYTPELEIVVDQSVKRDLELAKVLRNVLPPEEKPSGEDAAEDDDVVESNDPDR